MRFGYCASLDFLLTRDERSEEIFYKVLEAGYDYIELPLSAFLLISPEQRKGLENDMKAAGTPCLANFLLFPHDMPLTGKELSLKDIKAHGEKVLPIASELGSKNIIFGNGGSRRVREGMDRERVRLQLVQVLQAVAPAAERYGINIAVEPLRENETNMINSFTEAAGLAREVGSPRFGAVLDWYHASADKQDPDIPEKDRDRLFHLHIACPGERSAPSHDDDISLYEAFVRAVKTAGYNGRLSIEANIPEGRDIKKAVGEGLAVIKELFG